MALDDSLHWHLRSEVEWFVHSESEVFIDSLGLVSFIAHVVFVDDLPSLSWCSILAPNLDVVGFSISSSGNIKDLVVLDVGEEGSVILEDLPPVGVGAPDLDVIGSS